MRPQTAGKALLLIGVATAIFGMYIPTYSGMGPNPLDLPPCLGPIPLGGTGDAYPCHFGFVSGFGLLFYVGLVIIAFGALVVVIANRTEIAWRTNP